MRRGEHGNKSDDKSHGDEIAAREELENLQRVFSELVKKEVGKITKEKIFATMKRLKFPNVTMGLVEDLIWEVDEDCDGMLSWDEFKGMFFCVRNDKTGWEPRRLFNLVEFMMYDKDQGGSIDMDECMEIFFRRFGKLDLESRVADFMMHDTNADQEISFAEFVEMDKKQDLAGTNNHPGFKLSVGMIATTKQENARLLKMIRG